jgi:hypothetical protein
MRLRPVDVLRRRCEPPLDVRLKRPVAVRGWLLARVLLVRAVVVRRDDDVRLDDRLLVVLRRDVPDEARCGSWPFSPCSFITVRAATSFARLP